MRSRVGFHEGNKSNHSNSDSPTDKKDTNSSNNSSSSSSSSSSSTTSTTSTTSITTAASNNNNNKNYFASNILTLQIMALRSWGPRSRSKTQVFDSGHSTTREVTLPTGDTDVGSPHTEQI